MSKIKRWANVAGDCIVSGTYCGDGEIDPDLAAEWSPDIIEAIAVPGLHLGDEVEIYIEFQSTGHDDPGQSTGPVEQCYPPEGDDERVIISAIASYYRDGGLQQAIQLPKSIYSALDSQFHGEIAKAEVEIDG